MNLPVHVALPLGNVVASAIATGGTARDPKRADGVRDGHVREPFHSDSDLAPPAR